MRGAGLLAGLLLVADAGPASTANLTVTQEVPVTATFLDHQRSQNSPALAADPTQRRFVAMANRVDGPTEYDCSLAVSGNEGRSWIPAQPVPTLPLGVEHCYAPEIAFDKSGRLYYLFVGLAGKGNTPVGVYLTHSTDRGRTFSSPVQVLGRRKYAVRMVIDRDLGPRGRIHLVWLAPSSEPSLGSLPLSVNPILAAHSDDGGLSFSEPVQVSDRHRSLVVAPALALGSDHAVHVIYYDLGDDRRDYQGLEGPRWEGFWSLVAHSSVDGGGSFTPGAIVADDIVPPERVMLIFTMPPPAFTTGPRDQVYVAWWDARNGDWDVMLSTSLDSGGSWSSPARVHDDPVGNGRHQYLPALSVAPEGRLDAIFYDRRDDDLNMSNNVYYAYSDDDGATFAASQRLTRHGSFSGTGTKYPHPAARGLVEFGSRVALVSRPNSALAAWTDTRAVPHFFEHQDIFAAEVALEGHPGTGPLRGIAAGIAVLLGLGVIWARRRHSEP